MTRNSSDQMLQDQTKVRRPGPARYRLGEDQKSFDEIGEPVNLADDQRHGLVGDDRRLRIAVRASAELALPHLNACLDDGQGCLHFVGDARNKLAQCGHLVLLMQLLFQPGP